jgi:ABC-type nitrate/sulfonate/bicarbonate transport system substrate-binding protein
VSNRRGVSGGLLLAVIAVLALGRAGAQGLDVGAQAPEVGGGPWINSAPLTTAELRGRVVLVEFWTYG